MVGKKCKYYIFIHGNLSLYKHSQLARVPLSPEPSILIINQFAETLYLFSPIHEGTSENNNYTT